MELRVMVAVAASAVLLAGCSPMVAAPAEPSRYAVIAASNAQLEATWELTGLDGSPDRTITAAASDDEWHEVVASCMETQGVSLRRVRAVEGGYSAIFARGTGDVEAAQRVWFQCFSAHPPPPPIASREQLEYLWGYYARWVIPCVKLNGYELNRLPTRDRFLENGTFRWTPYGATVDLLSDREYDMLVATCGPELGMIER